MEATTQRAKATDNLNGVKSYHKMNYKVERMRVSLGEKIAGVVGGCRPRCAEGRGIMGIKSAGNGVGGRLHSIYQGGNECKMLDWISVYGQKSAVRLKAAG